MPKSPPTVLKRALQLGILVSITLLVLMGRLFFIQLVMGAEYRDKALQQRMVKVAVQNVRGNILDRNGIPFTQGKEHAYLILFPGLFHHDSTAFPMIQSMTGVTEERFSHILTQSQTFTKMEILRPIPNLELEIEKGSYPGIMIFRDWERYDENSLARHMIGYLRKSDHVPMVGLEKELNESLDAGSSRMIYALTDAKNRVIPGFGFKYQGVSKPYYDIQLTLDYYIQKLVEETLDEQQGRYGAVVVDVETGDILAVASRPNFDQNNIMESIGDSEALRNINLVPCQPGSVFKTIVAAAALETGHYHQEDTYFCEGGIDVKGVFYSCHPASGGLGELTLRSAFAHSCNDTFIKIGSQLGGGPVVEMAKRFGFGQSLDIGLANGAGNLPDKDVYAGPGIGNLSIGQGEVMVTPLQVADMMTTIANDGVRKKINLLRARISDTGKSEKLSIPQEIDRIISPETARTLREWMGDVTEYGTAVAAKDEEIGGTAGKTGTPQVAGDPNSSYYGWFAGFFPREHPKYVIVVLSKEEGGGGDTAAPVFRKIAHKIWEYESDVKEIR